MIHGKIYRDVTETVGNTPLIYLNRLTTGLSARVAVKHEGFNPFSSVKDRIGLAMIEDAIAHEVLRPGMLIVEPTSGNTGIGLAYAAVVRGYRCIFTMPETMTAERQNLLRALGCKVVLTKAEEGLLGTIARADEIASRLGERAWMPNQISNFVNPEAHYRTTGPEIWTDTAGELDIFVAAVGTGGTITGAGRFLREQNPEIHIVGAEPTESPLLSGGKPGPHQQVGLGGMFITDVLDTSIFNEVIKVTDQDAFETTRRLAQEEAIFAGISSGSATWAALQIAAREENRGKLIVALLPDFGERYMSNPVYAELPDPDFSDVAEALGPL